MSDAHAGPTRSLVLPTGEEQLVVRRARILVEEGPEAGLEVPLPEGPCLVGRGEEADLLLSDPSVSRAHLRLHPCREGWRLQDLGSRSGTKVDGLRVETVILGEKHEIHLGKSRLVFLLSEELMVLPAEGEGEFEGLFGESQPMKRLFRMLEKVGPLDLPVLLRGESGTGKEGIARAIHARSARARAPYVVVDCTVLGGEHLRSELFGHVKGAYTGADRARVGAFERADGGTLFLDEVAELPLDLQPMLLRALELGEFTPLGGSAPHESRVRVVAASHRDLTERVAAGTFREDLYFRLAGIELDVPPLRDRGTDIEGLATRFLAGRAQLSAAAREAIRGHDWPGNVRELEHAVERAAALCDGGVIEPDDLVLRGARTLPPEKIAATPSTETLAETEARRIREVLERHDWNKTTAAEALGINRVTLWRKVKRLGIQEP